MVHRIIMWSEIWKVKMLPKIKVWGWKLAANAVVVRENLSQRGVQTILTCPLSDQVETQEHLIMGCD